MVAINLHPLQHYETLNETDEPTKVEPPSKEVKKNPERARDRPKYLSDYVICNWKR